MPTRQSKYDCVVSKQAVPFRANTVGGLLRHVVSRNDGGDDLQSLNSVNQFDS